MLQSSTLRHCTMLGHDEGPVVMICTSKNCMMPKRWMCLECMILHTDHMKECLPIKKFSQLVHDDNQKYIFQQRKLLVNDILKQFQQQKDLILSYLKKLEHLYLTWLTELEQEEINIQELYSQVNAKHALAFTDEEIASLLTMDNEQESIVFQQNQTKAFEWMKNMNVSIDNIGQELKQVVEIKHGVVKEQVEDSKFTFVGQYTFGLKVGRWSILNRQGEMIGGGNYNLAGHKQGQWIDIEQIQRINIDLNYAQLIGMYEDGKRIDQWVIKNEDGIKIGGGYYNQSGNQVGQWIDVELSYTCYYQHIGEYQDGKRINQWLIKEKVGNIIGGGNYNQLGNKDGEWIDLEFRYICYYQHIGNYQDGKRIDQWNFKNKDGIIIGGGNYNELGNKDGEWIDLELRYNLYYQHLGKYQNQKAIGQWEIKNEDENIIGGGKYNQLGIKDGQWIDIELNYNCYYQHIGNYKDGIRINQWEIKDKQGKNIGGGHYNQSGIKVGLWIDIELNYNCYYQHIGIYQYGTRIDKWEIKDKDGTIIGGGNYNQFGIKEELWTEIELKFNYYYQHIGNYKDGKMIDQWVIQDKEGNKVGGGGYNQNGSKDGQWIDIELKYFCYYKHIGKYHDGRRIDLWEIQNEEGAGGYYNQEGSKDGPWIDKELNYASYYQHIGLYQNGMRVSQWEIKNTNGDKIGGGLYNQFGSKDGEWLEIEANYSSLYQHIGKYRDGTRIEKWEVKNVAGIIIGGGNYNQCGIKEGQWIDFEMNYNCYYLHIGKYQEGKRVDQWEIKNQDGEKIGEGYYNQSGILQSKQLSSQ